jgi:glucokinase
VCLYIGDEVFAGLRLAGKPWSGAHGRAGAAAWLALNPVERQDYRKLGSLAAEVSAKGIARRLSWRIQAGDRSRVLDSAGGSLEAITGQLVFDGARGGDGVAISVVRDTAKYIGMAVATLAAAIDPEVVVVAGSVAAADLMLEPVRQECARRLPPDAMADLRVEFSTLGPDAIAIGAARLALSAQSPAR